jgi:hypothetical protein
MSTFWCLNLNFKTVPDLTMTYIRGCMQMVFCHMIYLPETEQYKTMRYSNTVSLIIGNIYIQMLTIHSINVLCSRWVLFVMPDSSSRLPCCSMRLLPPPLLVLNWLYCSRLGGPGLPHTPPPPKLTPFPSGSRHIPASSSDTKLT